MNIPNKSNGDFFNDVFVGEYLRVRLELMVEGGEGMFKLCWM